MENQAQTSQSHYNCEHCGRIYKRKSSLQHHITIKHEEITLLKVKLQNEKIFVEVAKKMYEAEFQAESLNKSNY